jgi:hypothetical protein
LALALTFGKLAITLVSFISISLYPYTNQLFYAHSSTVDMDIPFPTASVIISD